LKNNFGVVENVKLELIFLSILRAKACDNLLLFMEHEKQIELCYRNELSK